MPRWNKNWRLEVNYELTSRAILSTKYFLYNSPYLLLWINQWKQYKSRSKDGLYSWFINKTKKDLPQIYERLVILLNKLRNNDIKDIPNFDPNFSQEQFNEWHKIFEERVHTVPIDLNNDYMELNSIIHVVETIHHAYDDYNINFRSIIGVLGLDEAQPLKKEYQLFSQHSEEWGDLIMSYSTTGKNWIEVVNTNDLEIVRSGGTTNKTLIRQEFITYFRCNDTAQSPHLRQLDQFKRIYEWYSSLPEDLKPNVPIEDLNELFFRNLYLGQIDFQRLPDIDFNRYLENNSYKLEYQKHFNLNYFNKVKKVSSIVFRNLTTPSQTFTVNNHD